MLDAIDDRPRSAQLRHVVVTVHGIRTFGGWQSRLARLIREREPDCEIRSYKFNYFSMFAFWFPPTRWLVVRKFARSLDGLAARGAPDRLDIVAHSFGTHLVAWGLRRARQVPRVHTLILSGSVLRASHFWDDLIPTRVGRLVNECGHRDSILIISQLFVPLTGMAGRVGFVGLLGPELQNRYFEFGHSGYFTDVDGKPDDSFMREHWLPILTGDDPALDIDRRGEVTPLAGIQLTVLQWLDPVKSAAVWGTVGLAFLFLMGLWADAAMTRDRLGATTDLIQSASKQGAVIDQTAAQSLVDALRLPLGTSHVLWVDDDPNRNILERQALKRWNVCFTNVRGTREAVQKMMDTPGRYALVISDWERPNSPSDTGATTAEAVAGLRTEGRPALIFYVSPKAATDPHRKATQILSALDETGDPFFLSQLSLGAIASSQSVGDGGWSSWFPASLSTGLSWFQRHFLKCSMD